jgi:hypothetical protein
MCNITITPPQGSGGGELSRHMYRGFFLAFFFAAAAAAAVGLLAVAAFRFPDLAPVVAVLLVVAVVVVVVVSALLVGGHTACGGVTSTPLSNSYLTHIRYNMALEEIITMFK